MSKSHATNADALGIDHMHAFIAVVETGSQGRAAKRLRVAQTTVSRHIERVQEHFGGGLFEAGASGRLSARGLLVEQSIRSVLSELSRTRDRLALDRPVLRIGFIRPMRSLVEQALRSQVKAHGIPAFDVRLTESTAEEQARALGRRELDIAICYALAQFAAREGFDESIIAEQPFALVVPARACARGKPSSSILSGLVYAYSPRRFSEDVSQAEQRWLEHRRIVPQRSVECARGSEILAYAGAGYGFGFLPALWSMTNHDGVVFVPVPDFGVTAKVAAYSLRHVQRWVTRLRENLSLTARTALSEFPTTPTSAG